MRVEKGRTVIRIGRTTSLYTQGRHYVVIKTNHVMDNKGDIRPLYVGSPLLWRVKKEFDNPQNSMNLTDQERRFWGQNNFVAKEQTKQPIYEQIVKKVHPQLLAERHQEKHFIRNHTADKINRERVKRAIANLAMTAVAEQSLGEPPANNYNNQEENNMDRINSGPLRGLSVGDKAYSFISGAVTVLSITSERYRNRPIRVRSKANPDMYASFQINGIKRCTQSNQQLFLTEEDMLMARDGHVPTTTEITKPMKRFTTQTLINGLNVDNMSDDQVFSSIAEMENEIESLGKIENKPARLIRQIKDIRKDIASIVAYLDSNDSEVDAEADATS